MLPGVYGVFVHRRLTKVARLSQLGQRFLILDPARARAWRTPLSAGPLNLIGPVLVPHHEIVMGQLQLLNLRPGASDVSCLSRAKRARIRDHGLCPGKTGPRNLPPTEVKG